MARIICFSDTAAVIHAVQQGLNEGEHTIHLLSASRLTSELRETVQRLAPDIILLELSHATDNPHLYFFLRATRATRDIPIILVSTGQRLAQQAEILGADGYLQRPFASEQLRSAVTPYLELQRAVAAA
jgi:CheY-like chemotaxis protein